VTKPELEPRPPTPPPVLYRYRALDQSQDFDPGRLGYLASILRDQVLHVPCVGKFNDPWEGRPNFVVGDSSGDAAAILASFFARMNPEGNGTSPWEPAIANEYRSRIAQFGLPAVFHELRSQFARLMASRLVLCLSEPADDALMWSYYVDGHNGYALCFSTDAMPFRLARRVVYSAEYPALDVQHAQEPNYALDLTVFRKADIWAHECEWRILMPWRSGLFEWHSIQPDGELGGAYVRFPRPLLRRVVIGAQVSGLDATHIERLARLATPPVPTVRCRLAATRFHVDVPAL
jgi:hypothetical protein